MTDYYYKHQEKEKNMECEFNEHQYEDIVEDGRFYYKINVDARYIYQEMPEFQGNMLIEALPPMYQLDQLLPMLLRLPLYDESESKKDNLYREQAIYRLHNCVIPLANYLDIEKKLSILIRRGYIGRMVMTKRFIQTINHNSGILRDKSNNKLIELRSIVDNTVAPFPGFALIGISGGGKSTVLENILSLYPQAIKHTFYNGESFLFRQLVYIKINCSHGGSLKGICREFFEEVDKVLGTEYMKKFGTRRSSAYDMVADMANVTQLHALGVLIIDEIQHLSVLKTNQEEVLNFFTNLESKMHIPIIFCGTYKAIKDVLSKEFRQARRTSGMGEVFWNTMSKDKEFKKFIDKIWKYQWTNKKVEINEEILEAFYEKTMGITDRIVKLFMAVQLEAILSREEEITIELINKVADKYMKLTKPMIDALRSGDPDTISDYDDLYCVDYRVIREKCRNEFINQNKIKEIYEAKVYEDAIHKDDVKNKLILSMLEIGVEEKKARKYAIDMIKEFGYEKGIDHLRKKIIDKVNGENAQYKIDKKEKKLKDIRKEQTSGYEKLKKEDKIKGDLI